MLGSKEEVEQQRVVSREKLLTHGGQETGRKGRWARDGDTLWSSDPGAKGPWRNNRAMGNTLDVNHKRLLSKLPWTWRMGGRSHNSTLTVQCLFCVDFQQASSWSGDSWYSYCIPMDGLKADTHFWGDALRHRNIVKCLRVKDLKNKEAAKWGPAEESSAHQMELHTNIGPPLTSFQKPPVRHLQVLTYPLLHLPSHDLKYPESVKLFPSGVLESRLRMAYGTQKRATPKRQGKPTG